jgi:Ca2+-binding RTX toxin-like protein
VTTTITADFVQSTGSTLTSVDEAGVSVQGSAWSNVTFNGLVQVNIPTDSFPVIGVIASSGGAGPAPNLTIGATGDLEVNSTAPSGFAGGFSAGDGINLVNRGTIDVRSLGEAQGVSTGSGGFQNQGVLTVSASSNVTGVTMEHGGDFANSGTITVTGASGAFEGAVGVSIYNSVGEHQINNSGTIHAVSMDSAIASVGVQVAGFTTLVNTGTIQADKAIVFVRDDNLVNGGEHHLTVTNSGTLAGAVYLNNSAAEPVTLSNSGQIVGDVTLNNSADFITNTGVITGHVDLGSGNDHLSSSNGTITGNVIGGDGDDTLAGGAGAGTLDGGAGSDSLVGGRGAEALLGGDGNDTINAVYNNTQVEGGAGDDSITLSGEYTTDPLHLQRLDGGDGNDSFVVYAFPGQALTIDGGAGHNTLEMHNFGTNTSPIVLHLNGGDTSGGAWVGLGLQTVTVIGHAAEVTGGDGGQTITAPGVINGGSGDDVLTGSDPQVANPSQLLMALTGADTLNGGDGNDTINGLSGRDSLSGGAGDDSIQGGAGDDTLVGGAGADTLSGGAGVDVFQYNQPSESSASSALGGHTGRLDHILGWSSTDFLQYVGDAAATSSNYREITAADYDTAYNQAQAAFSQGVNYTAAQVGSDVIVFAPHGGYAVDLVGATLADLSEANLGPTPGGVSPPPPPPPPVSPPPPPSGGGGGGSGQIVQYGSDGDDHMIAFPGGTEVHAGFGNDTIQAASVSDYLRGDAGNDSIQGGAAFDDINGNQGNDTIDGGSGGGDWLVGGQGDDLIFSHHSDDILYGNLGNDTLMGGDGVEIIRGGQGDDSIVGGAGNDFISGDRGNDTESGGAGADIFHTSQDAGIDKVLDFHVSEGDRVELDPGTTFTVSQVGSDTVIDMGSGNQMILVGVQLSTLTPGWIFGA